MRQPSMQSGSAREQRKAAGSSAGKQGRAGEQGEEHRAGEQVSRAGQGSRAKQGSRAAGQGKAVRQGDHFFQNMLILALETNHFTSLNCTFLHFSPLCSIRPSLEN